MVVNPGFDFKHTDGVTDRFDPPSVYGYFEKNRRRSSMFMKLFLLFTIIPVVELAILIRLGGAIGIVPTVAIVVLTGLAGAWLARTQGFGVLAKIRARMAEGAFPADELLDGLLVLAAGIVLITPGILTDITGFLLLIPFTRRKAKNLLSRYIRNRLQGGTIDYRGF